MVNVVKVLFLDDMEWRHSEFSRTIEHLTDIVTWRARSAVEAIELLRIVAFDQVFLDHDLSDDDVMMIPGSMSSVPTGMDVVDYIVEMEAPPPWVVVHSCNGPARDEMAARLKACPGVKTVDAVPFPELMSRLDER